MDAYTEFFNDSDLIKSYICNKRSGWLVEQMLHEFRARDIL